MMTPDISVVIIVRNQPEAHKIALHSLLNVPQCHEKWEVIVCDNGSNPPINDSVEWDYYSKQIPIRYIDCTHQRGWLGATRNVGINEARAPYILCLDGDIILPEMLVQRHLDKHQGFAKIVGGSRKWRTIDIDVPSHLNPRDSYQILLNSKESLDEKTRNRENRELDYAFNICSNKKYLSCLGFQLSFLKNKDTIFSPELKGWGFEDREFVLRQMRKQTHEIVYAPDLQVWHLDSQERSFNPFRNAEIDTKTVTQFLINMTYMIERYQDIVDLNDVYYGLDRIYYNSKNDDWRLLDSNLKRPPSERSEKYIKVVRWLYKHGYTT